MTLREQLYCDMVIRAVAGNWAMDAANRRANYDVAFRNATEAANYFFERKIEEVSDDED